MAKKGIILLLVGLVWASGLSAAHDRKVILLAQKNYQADSLGYNLVDDATRYFYQWIQEDKIVLWDSPEKKRKISFQELQGIETTTQSHFTNTASILIYELWQIGRKEYKTAVKGFSIIGKTNLNEDVLYGFIEQDNNTKALLQKAYLSIGVQAPYGITISQVLSNRLYDADLVFYDGIPVVTVKESNKFKKTALGGKKNLSFQKIPNTKMVEYAIQTGPGKASLLSADIQHAMENFFDQNAQEFYNYGGDRIYSFLKKTPVLISEIRVDELFTLKNGELLSNAVYIIPYILGLPMDPIPADKFNQWEFTVDSVPFKTVLTQREYFYNVRSINGNNIPEEKEELVRNLLFNKEWTKFADKTL